MTTGKRGRGAPRGNLNALKHGYYARKLPAQPSAEPENQQFQRLADEKQMIRFFLGRLVALGAQTQDLDQVISLTRIASLSVTTLMRIIRTESIAGFLQGSPTNEELFRVINLLEEYADESDGFPDAMDLGAIP